MGFGIVATLDTDDDFGGVLGILCEVGVKEVDGVVLGRAVEKAAVPEVGAFFESFLHDGDGGLDGLGFGSPGEAHEAETGRADGFVGEFNAHDAEI